jgi:hypothetical protein
VETHRTGEPRDTAKSWAAWTAEHGNTMVLDIGGCTEVAQLKVKDCAQLLAVNSSFWPIGG